eukprot:7674580-Alexandrium_andersonii.AAC.1
MPTLQSTTRRSCSPTRCGNSTRRRASSWALGVIYITVLRLHGGAVLEGAGLVRIRAPDLQRQRNAAGEAEACVLQD